MTNTIDGNNVLYAVKALDDTDSTYQGEGEEIFTVDTSNGALTVELRDGDTSAGFHKRFFDTGGNIETNAVTFTTEGSAKTDGTSGNTVWDHNNNSYVDWWSDGTDWFSSLQGAAHAFATEKADITGETYVELSLSADQTGIASGTWTNPFDTEDEDNLNEVNASQQFDPGETGIYRITAFAGIGAGSAGDSLEARLRNTTDGTTESPIRLADFEAAQAENETIPINWVGQLTSGKDYEIQVRGNGSQFSISSNRTYGTIVREIVHP